MKTLAVLIALIAAAPAVASTDAAWAAGHRAAQAACIRASGLVGASASAPIDFSDRTAQSVLLVRGTYPQRFMKGASGTMLCLYDRRSKRAEISEAKGWTAQ
jgi:hypothetical protein